MENIQKKIAQIRQMFEQELLNNDNNNNNYHEQKGNNSLCSSSSSSTLYHPVDLDRVRCEDWQIQRYLIDCVGDVQEAYHCLLRTLQWKKKFGVHELSITDFPSEFYQLFKIEDNTTAGTDPDGLPIFTEYFASQRCYPELQQCFRQLIVAWIERMDRLAGEKGIVYLGDLSNTPILGIDKEMGQFRVEILNRHYPLLTRRIIFHNAPLLIGPILRLIVAFMKPSIRDIVVYTKNVNQLSQFIDKKVIHKDLGGGRDGKRIVPEGVVSFRDCHEKFGIDRKYVEWFLKYNNLL